jgi:hypothetical protein
LTSSYTDGALTAITLPAGARLLVGHVDEAGRHDPQVPIPAREYGPGDFWADARCRHCPARSELGQLGAGVMTLVIHRNGCPELGAIRELAVAP